MHDDEIVAKIAAIYSQHANDVASGYRLQEPFKLRTRKGCEYDNTLVPPTKFGYINESRQTREAKTTLEECLKAWYDNANVHEQITKVNEQVRHAREIPASEFSVETELLKRIAGLWDKHFYPYHGVCVQPYKIHLYGPEGYFDVHRDAHQKDLISSGYRAVIAFKLFSAATRSKSTTSSEVRQQTTELVRQLQAPLGIILERKYCLGTTELGGFDALLSGSLHTLEDVDIQHLPVVVTSSGQWGQKDGIRCDTAVYPFTQGHIGRLADNSYWGEPNSWRYDGPRDHTSCRSPWLEGVKNAPFFAFDFDRSESVLLYEDNERETVYPSASWLSSRTLMSSSVYLLYVVIALPKDRKHASGDR